MLLTTVKPFSVLWGLAARERPGQRPQARTSPQSMWTKFDRE